MAYILAVVGAGGKTTYCYERALEYKKQNKKVCIITTTHMCDNGKAIDPVELDEMGNVEYGYIYYFGRVENGKIGSVTEKEYNKICELFDYVVVEADGSMGMPLKIPNYDYEPVVPANVNEIVIVVGMQALSRKLGVVCHRFYEYVGKDKFLIDNNFNEDTIVTDVVIDKMVMHYYVEYLKNKYVNVPVSVYKCDMTKFKNYENYRTIAFALCASGKSSRFGKENKLLTKISIDGKEQMLYQIMIDKLVDAKKMLLEMLSKQYDYDNLNIEIGVASVYDEILNVGNVSDDIEGIKTFYNDKAIEGLSGSIRLLTNVYKDSDAIIFFNCDMPYLPVEEIVYFVFYSMCSNHNIAAMTTDMPKNPAFFGKEYYDELLKLEGDIGPRDILKRKKGDLYRYYVDKKYMIDIDTKEDIK